MRHGPALLLPASLAIFWFVLNDSLAPADLLIALVIAIAVPWMAAPLSPRSGPLRKPRMIAGLVLRVGADVIVSALQVGRRALRPGSPNSTGQFVTVPLDLRSPNALAALAVITTVVPGSVWSELAPDRSAVLLHVFGVDDAAGFVRMYKTRYERPLMEIFE